MESKVELDLRKMKVIFMLFWLLLVAQSTLARNIASGQVVDAETDKGILDVNIGSIELMKGTVSDDEGSFSLIFNNKDDLISFSAIGYKPIKVSDKNYWIQSQ